MFPCIKTSAILFEENIITYAESEKCDTSLNLTILGCLSDLWLIISRETFSSIWYAQQVKLNKTWTHWAAPTSTFTTQTNVCGVQQNINATIKLNTRFWSIN